MAAVLSETITNNTYFPTMGRGDEHRRSPITPQYRQPSRTRPHTPPSPRPQPVDTIPQQRTSTSAGVPYILDTNAGTDPETRIAFASQQHFANPSLPQARESHLQTEYVQDDISNPSSNPRMAPHLVSPATSVNSPISGAVWPSDDLTRYGERTIKVRDLAHIQSFASEEFLSLRGDRRQTGCDPPLRYEISSMPITDIIEMVAGLLTKITTTNDRQHENLHRPMPSAETAANISGLASSVLAFHGKNVPSITILSYLSRIHKYCPTTYEVFLSLLVYFDRMTERVNAAPMQEIRTTSSGINSRPSTARSMDEEIDMSRSPSLPHGSDEFARGHYATPPDDDQIPYNLSHFFVVDSFNIHRLVIAGVTCASKFFSDVFYTNSRYAKVKIPFSQSYA
jgi:PHO85 cyclin-6/7